MDFRIRRLNIVRKGSEDSIISANMLSSIRAFFKGRGHIRFGGRHAFHDGIFIIADICLFLNPTEFGKLDVILVYTALSWWGLFSN
jgi:hypothetical protein